MYVILKKTFKHIIECVAPFACSLSKAAQIDHNSLQPPHYLHSVLGLTTLNTYSERAGQLVMFLPISLQR